VLALFFGFLFQMSTEFALQILFSMFAQQSVHIRVTSDSLTVAARFLLVSQGHHWVYTHCAAGRHRDCYRGNN
jgi:hypothetical protein